MNENTAPILPASDPEAISKAVEIIQANGLVAFPTDTVYGLGASILSPRGLLKIYKVKNREEDKPLPILIHDANELEFLSSQSIEGFDLLTNQFWPGPLTIVVRKSQKVPELVSRGATVGVRVPDHPTALDLLRQSGALAVTSANRSGMSSPTTAEAVMDQLASGVDLVLDGGDTRGGIPSTVLDCSESPARILREGPIARSQLEKLIPIEPS